jgi:calpain-15
MKWTVYSSPEPSDIQQGELGDCWLMAALALITERPKMLEHILLTKKINKEGVYLVRLCHNGLWKTVIVDDCFPCTESRQLAYTKANRYQLYVPLIEKACAKLFGSYAELTAGQTEEGLQLLTGASCDHIDLEPSNFILDKDIVWAKLLSACESQ